MMRALRLLRSSISTWYYDFFVLLAVNVIWLVLSALIIPIGPATAGLFYIANEAAKGEPLSFGLFWQGMRRYAGPSIKLAIAIVVITLLLIVNIQFYLGLNSTIGQIIGIIWIYVFIFWGLVLNYPYALLVQAEKPSLVKILRNSLLIFMDNIAFSLSMTFIAFLLIVLSVFPLGFLPYVFGFFSLMAIFQCKCVLLLMEKYEPKQQTT